MFYESQITLSAVAVDRRTVPGVLYVRAHYLEDSL